MILLTCSFYAVAVTPLNKNKSLLHLLQTILVLHLSIISKMGKLNWQTLFTNLCQIQQDEFIYIIASTFSRQHSASEYPNEDYVTVSSLKQSWGELRGRKTGSLKETTKRFLWMLRQDPRVSKEQCCCQYRLNKTFIITINCNRLATLSTEKEGYFQRDHEVSRGNSYYLSLERIFIVSCEFI